MHLPETKTFLRMLFLQGPEEHFPNPSTPREGCLLACKQAALMLPTIPNILFPLSSVGKSSLFGRIETERFLYEGTAQW